MPTIFSLIESVLVIRAVCLTLVNYPMQALPLFVQQELSLTMKLIAFMSWPLKPLILSCLLCLPPQHFVLLSKTSMKPHSLKLHSKDLSWKMRKVANPLVVQSMRSMLITLSLKQWLIYGEIPSMVGNQSKRTCVWCSGVRNHLGVLHALLNLLSHLALLNL